jgi:hypothetical protein
VKYLKKYKVFESDIPIEFWWQNNYKDLIEYANSLQYEDWLDYFSEEEDVEDLLQGILELTGKHKARLLMDIETIEKLDNILKNFKNEDI